MGSLRQQGSASGKTSGFPGRGRGCRTSQVELLGWDPGTSWQWAGLACGPSRFRCGTPGPLAGAGLPRWLAGACSLGIPGGGRLLHAFWLELGAGHPGLGQSHRTGWSKPGTGPPAQVLPMGDNVPKLAQVGIWTLGHAGGGWDPNASQPEQCWDPTASWKGVGSVCQQSRAGGLGPPCMGRGL